MKPILFEVNDEGLVVIPMTVLAKESATESANGVFRTFRNKLIALSGIKDVQVEDVGSVSPEDMNTKVFSFVVIPSQKQGKTP